MDGAKHWVENATVTTASNVTQLTAASLKVAGDRVQAARQKIGDIAENIKGKVGKTVAFLRG